MSAYSTVARVAARSEGEAAGRGLVLGRLAVASTEVIEAGLRVRRDAAIVVDVDGDDGAKRKKRSSPYTELTLCDSELTLCDSLIHTSNVS